MLNAGTGTGMDVLDLIALLVFLAAIFTFINIHYLKLPATIGLMILALVMSVVIVGIGILYEPLRNAAEEIMLRNGLYRCSFEYYVELFTVCWSPACRLPKIKRRSSLRFGFGHCRYTAMLLF